MKRIASILLIGLLLFNWYGYRLLIGYLEDKAGRELQIRLDNDNYNHAEQITIKVPAHHLPYYYNSTVFDDVNGQIDINGIPYKFVKQRLFNDSIELVCAPDHEAQKLRSARDRFFTLVNDLQRSTGAKKSNTHHRESKPPASEGCPQKNSWQLDRPARAIDTETSYYLSYLVFFSYPVIENPPESLVS